MEYKQLVKEFGQFKADCCTSFQMSQGQFNNEVSRFLF